MPKIKLIHCYIASLLKKQLGNETMKQSNSQSGIAQILVLLLLVAGIGLGTYLVQQRTNILPFADCGNDCYEGDRESEPEHAQDEQQTQVSSDDNSSGDNNSSSTDNSQTDQNNTTSDGQSLNTQDSETQKSFNAAFCSGPDDNCDAAKQQWATEHSKVVVSVKSDKVTTSDGQSLGTQDKATRDMFNTAYCNGDANANCDAAKQQWAKEHVVDVNTKGSDGNIQNCRNSTDGCNNPKSLNGQNWNDLTKEEKALFEKQYCTPDHPADGSVVIPHCQSAKKIWMTQADNNCRAAGTCGGSGGKILSEAEKIAAQKKADIESKAVIDKTREDLKGQGFVYDPDNCPDLSPQQCINKNIKACADRGKDEQSCKQKMEVLFEITEAQKAHDYIATSGLTGASLIAALDDAKLKDRIANCDAVAAGIGGANCVLDLGDNQNIIMAKVNGKDVRVFIGQSSKATSPSSGDSLLILNYRDPACTVDMNKASEICQLKRLTYDEAKPLLKGDITNLNELTSFEQLTPTATSSIQNLCDYSGRGCIAAAQASGTTPVNSNIINRSQEIVRQVNWEKVEDCPADCGRDSTGNQMVCIRLKGSIKSECYLSKLLEGHTDAGGLCKRTSSGAGTVCPNNEYCSYDGQCRSVVSPTPTAAPSPSCSPAPGGKPCFSTTGVFN